MSGLNEPQAFRHMRFLNDLHLPICSLLPWISQDKRDSKTPEDPFPVDGSHHTVSHAGGQDPEFQDVASLPGWRPIDYLSTSKMFSSLEETMPQKSSSERGIRRLVRHGPWVRVGGPSGGPPRGGVLGFFLRRPSPLPCPLNKAIVQAPWRAVCSKVVASVPLL